MLNPEPFSRREVLRIGGLSLLAGTASAAAASPIGIGHSSCLFIMLQGGLSQLESWDPKPQAVAEIRGPFRPISTTTPGMLFGELMKDSARVSQHLCIVRSMTHKFTNHIAGTYITLTGSTNQQDRDREAHGDDFPGPGAVLNRLTPRSTASSAATVPQSISLPNWLSIPGPSNRMPGQYAGFLGSVYDPMLLEGDPSQKEYRPLSLTLPDGMTTQRMQTRLSLMRDLDSAARLLEHELSQQYDQLKAAAWEMVVSGAVRKALNLAEEPDSLRDRYGRNRVGQSLLLARRLIEAGVRFVSFNEFNQKWDTHGGLERRYREIVPEMDTAFAALISDLHDRGLLHQTLVINTGEFGRTPKINDGQGRDHWPNVYSTVLAGGSIPGGTVYGSSDSKAAEVLSQPVSPADILATMWHHLGIPPRTELRDRLDRPQQLCEGRPLTGVQV
ncbi:MAG: DUF1501 domain-containing protein [Planctomycetaceae bacterium]